MKDLKKIYAEVIDDLESLDIPYGTVTKVFVNTRAKSRWGRCSRTRGYNGTYTYTIQVSDRLLQDDLDDMALKDTLAHELIHTVKGCMNHGPEWKKWGDKLSVYGYNIKRCTSSEEKGISREEIITQYKYEVICNGCDKRFYYNRKTNALKSIMSNRGTCYCPRCKGRKFTVNILK